MGALRKKLFTLCANCKHAEYKRREFFSHHQGKKLPGAFPEALMPLYVSPLIAA